MSHSVYNTDKNRKATLNELAKWIIMDRIENVIIGEQWGTEDLTEDEIQEVVRHMSKHVSSISKKLNPRGTYFEWR